MTARHKHYLWVRLYPSVLFSVHRHLNSSKSLSLQTVGFCLALSPVVFLEDSFFMGSSVRWRFVAAGQGRLGFTKSRPPIECLGCFQFLQTVTSAEGRLILEKWTA